jgi:hypothetical protein
MKLTNQHIAPYFSYLTIYYVPGDIAAIKLRCVAHLYCNNSLNYDFTLVALIIPIIPY